MLLRRFSAALAALLLLQLSLLGSGTLRAPHEMFRTSAASAHGMPPMPGMVEHQSGNGTRTQQDDGSPSAPAGCDTKGGAHDCGVPWSSGSCAAMTACATVAALPPVAVAFDQERARTAELPDPTLLRTGPTAAPELPPPRA
ncbi:MAG TPA: hypothetical protein VF461_21820 [Gemmatimonadaceae bacterium]